MLFRRAPKLTVTQERRSLRQNGCYPLAHCFLGSIAEFVGQNGAFQQQAGESVTRGDRRRRELEARSSSPPLARLLLGSLTTSGGNWWSDVDRFNYAVIR